MTNEKCRALTATPEENIEQKLPDLKTFYHCRQRDESLIKKACTLLVHGHTVGKVSLLLRLPVEKVQQLHDEGWNSRCRRVTRTNAYENARLALTSFHENALLADICAALDMPLYTLVMSLRQNGVPETAIQSRMPAQDDPLYVAYKLVVDRKSTSKFKPVKMYSNRKLHPNTIAAVQQIATKATA